MSFLALSFLLGLANRRQQQKYGGRKVKEIGCISQVFIMLILLNNPQISVVYYIYFLLWGCGMAVGQLILPGLSLSPGFKLGLYLLIVFLFWDLG